MILVQTRFCGEWNLEFGSNTTEKFEISRGVAEDVCTKSFKVLHFWRFFSVPLSRKIKGILRGERDVEGTYNGINKFISHFNELLCRKNVRFGKCLIWLQRIQVCGQSRLLQAFLVNQGQAMHGIIAGEDIDAKYPIVILTLPNVGPTLASREG